MDEDRVLLIGGGKEIESLLEYSFSGKSVEIHQVLRGEDGLSKAAVLIPSLVVAEVELPDISAFDLIAGIREWSSVPIIAIADRSGASREVQLLGCGADDFLVRPLLAQEFKARLNVALRHSREFQPKQPSLRVGDFVLSFQKQKVTCHGDEVDVAPVEYRILSELARQIDHVVTHRSLQMKVWGRVTPRNRENLRVFVSFLRKKLRNQGCTDVLLETVRGVGYRFARQ